jgi:exo-beta-1,3-glucanase (GH17 family)
MDLVEGYTDANHSDMIQALNDVLPFTDYFGVSVYPFISNFLCDSIPTDMFNKVFALSTKPICITETGYPAEHFTVLGGSLVFEGSPEKQKNYISLLLNEAEQHDLQFVINFVLRDYDALWVAIGSPDDINKLWRDTGLYDQDGNSRIAHQTWMQWLSR